MIRYDAITIVVGVALTLTIVVAIVILRVKFHVDIRRWKGPTGHEQDVSNVPAA